MLGSLIAIAGVAKEIGSITSAAKGLIDVYSAFTGLTAGGEKQKTMRELERLNVKIERLSPNVLWAPGATQIAPTLPAQLITEGRNVRQILDPLASGFETEILAGSMMLTPPKLRRAFHIDPFSVLHDPRPIRSLSEFNHPGPGYLPITFTYDEMQFIGWQKVGALPQLFDFEYSASPVLVQREQIRVVAAGPVNAVTSVPISTPPKSDVAEGSSTAVSSGEETTSCTGCVIEVAGAAFLVWALGLMLHLW